MPGPVDDRTGYKQLLDRASAQSAVMAAQHATAGSPVASALGFFTDNAAERAQREQDAKFAAIIGDHSDYLAKALAADPKKLAAVQADPLSFARSYGSQAWMSPVDHATKVAAADLPPTIQGGRQVATPATAAAAAAPAMSLGQRSAQNQVDYITALRSNPAMKGMTFRDLAGYVGLQPQPAKAVNGKDLAIDQTVSLIEQQYQAAQAAASHLGQTDPQKASEVLLAAGQKRMSDYMRLTTPPDPVGEAVAAQQQK